MDSASIGHLGFSVWHPFQLTDKESILKMATTDMGVYVIRRKGDRFGRLRGRSDILYIGKTEARKGMNARIGAYFNPGPTQWTNQRINLFLKRREPMEISFVIMRSPGRLESQLLAQYLAEHDELPPLNRRE